MPLTNAEKQARSRQRKAERVARYEAALQNLVSLTRGNYSLLAEQVNDIAKEALDGRN